MSYNYSNVLNSPGKGLPTNQTVPNLYNGLVNPTQKALSAKMNSPLLPPLKNTSTLPTGQLNPNQQTTPQNFVPKPDIHQGLVTSLNKQGGTHTTTDAQGNTTTTKINPANGTSTGITGNGGPTGTQTTPTGPTTTPTGTGLVTQPTAPQDTSYGGLQAQIAGAGAKTQAQQNATSQQIADLRTNLANTLGEQSQVPIPLNFQTGRNQIVQNMEAQKEAALQGQLQSQIAAGTQNIGALGTAAGLAAPQFQSYYNAQFNPVTGQYGTVGGGAYGSGPQAGANAQTEADFTKQYNEGKAKLAQADIIQNQIGQTIASNPDINNQPLSILTNLNQFISGQTGTAPQQLLAQQINSYVQTLGIDPASLVSLATQQKGTLAQLLESLRTTAAAGVESKNPATFKANLQANNGSASNIPTGSGLYNF